MQDTVEKVRVEVLGCQRCSRLAAYRKQVVFSYGSGINGLMFIGIAPSYVGGNITGKPMSDGRSKTGHIIQKILDCNRIKGEECYNTNILFCATPQNREPMREEVENCWVYTEREIRVIQPRLIILLGKIPSGCVLRVVYRKGCIYYKYGAACFPTYHPSYIIQGRATISEDEYIAQLSEVIHAIL